MILQVAVEISLLRRLARFHAFGRLLPGASHGAIFHEIARIEIIQNLTGNDIYRLADAVQICIQHPGGVFADKADLLLRIVSALAAERDDRDKTDRQNTDQDGQDRRQCQFCPN